MRLLDILIKHDIDGFEKNGGTDKNSFHSYLDTYEKILNKYKGKEINILEIGVQHGGSILLWHDFLPLANIIGTDIQNIIHEKIFDNIEPMRVRVYLSDAYSDKFISEITRDYYGLDVVIDDGPHTLDSQILCLIKYIPILNQGGTLIIEDIQSIENLYLLKSIANQIGYKNVEAVDIRHIKNRYDDLMLIAEKW